MPSIDLDQPLPPDCTPCYGRADLFFATDFDRQDQAKSLCGTCAHQARCLNIALRHNLTDGIFGGLDPQERGYYKRLYPGQVRQVQELPVRFRTKPKKRERTRSEGAA